ncbi:MAG: transketolase family protein [Brevinemataceae bacterium]
MSYKTFSTLEVDSIEIRTAIAQTLIEEAEKKSDIVVLDADLISSSGLGVFQKKFPSRTFNVGIMEAHMMGAAAGLSITGFFPFIHTFAPFASRRIFDQATLSGAYSNNSVTILASDPGIASCFNGGTHTTFEDIAMYRTLPNTIIFDLADTVQAASVIKSRINTYREGLCYIRFPRRGIYKIYQENSEFSLGKFPIAKQGSDIAIFTSGLTLSYALEAAYSLEKENISVRVIDCFTPSHMDKETILAAAKECQHLIAIENHSIHGGLASAVADVLIENHPVKLHRIGTHTFSEVGDLTYLAHKFGFSAEQITSYIKKLV